MDLYILADFYRPVSTGRFLPVTSQQVARKQNSAQIFGKFGHRPKIMSSKTAPVPHMLPAYAYDLYIVMFRSRSSSNNLTSVSVVVDPEDPQNMEWMRY